MYGIDQRTNTALASCLSVAPGDIVYFVYLLGLPGAWSWAIPFVVWRLPGQESRTMEH